MNKEAFTQGYVDQLAKLATVPNTFKYPPTARNQQHTLNQVAPFGQPAVKGGLPKPPPGLVLTTG